MMETCEMTEVIEEYKRAVNYHETDKMGIVHNSNYLRIFEEARLDFMNKAGAPYQQIEEGRILIPQIEALVKYHHTMAYGDEFRVKVLLTLMTPLRMNYSYEIHRVQDDRLIATGYTNHCFIDETTRIPVSIGKRQPEIYEALRHVVKAE